MRFILEVERNQSGNEVFSKQKYNKETLYIAKDEKGSRRFVNKEWIMNHAYYISNATFNDNSFSPCEDRFEWAYNNLVKDVKEHIDEMQGGFDVGGAGAFSIMIESTQSLIRHKQMYDNIMTNMKNHILQISGFKKYMKESSHYEKLGTWEYNNILKYYEFSGVDLYFQVIKGIITDYTKAKKDIYFLVYNDEHRLSLFANREKAMKYGSHTYNTKVVSCNSTEGIKVFNEFKEKVKEWVENN